MVSSEQALSVPWASPSIGEEEIEEVLDSLRSGWISMGPKVRALESELANYTGVKNAVAVSNGTAAMDAALRAVGIGTGDEVIIPCLTYIATVNAVRYQGATPVLADVDLRTFNIDPESVRQRITPRTKAVVAVDYGGVASDSDRLEQICDQAGLVFVKDGAHSLGGSYRGKSLLSYGRVSTLSLHSAKVMTSVEGGVVFSGDDEIARFTRMFRNQGEDPRVKYLHPIVGQNYRMSDVHAAIGLAQFRRLDAFLKKRREIAAAYTESVVKLDGVRLQQIPNGAVPSWFFYPILVRRRDKIVEALREAGVESRVGWPYPIHEQPPYRDLGAPGAFPHSEEVAHHVLNLPMFYGMTDAQRELVIGSLRSAIRTYG
jgi:perosamine synthetase